MPVANQYGIDLAGIQQGWDQSTSNALRGMMMGQQMKTMKREEDNQNALKQYLPGAMAGDQNALGQVLGANPQLGVSLMNQKRTLADKDRDLFQKQAPAIIKLFGDVQDDGTYQQRRQAAIQSGISGAEKFPPNFDPQFVGRLMQSAQAFHQPKYDIKETDKGFAAINTEDLSTKPIAGIAPKAEKTEIQKLQDYLGRLPEGDPKRVEVQNAIKKATTPGTGLKFESDGNGGFTLVQGPGAGSDGVTKTNTTRFQEDIVTNTQALDRIKTIKSLYEPEFLTYKGQAQGAVDTFLNKMNPNQRSQFQARRSAFISAANRDFLTFRKWATGVAGGEKEMAEIKRATFSEDDSPQDFEAKMDVAKSLYRRLNARTQAALSAGIDPQKNQDAFQKFLKTKPLDSVPDINERGKQLEALGYKPEQATQILITEGYINPGQAQ